MKNLSAGVILVRQPSNLEEGLVSYQMQMTDFSFLLYFLPAMFGGYFLLHFSRQAQNAWLVFFSFLFYSFGNYQYLLFLLALIAANYYLGYVAHHEQREPKVILILTLALNLLPLFFYKYLFSLLEPIFSFFSLTAPSFPAVPLGISFLALNGISYVMDIQRKKVEWNPRFTDTALYFSFFPPLTAGPIIRYHDVAGQIKNREIKFDNIIPNLCRFVTGLAKIIILGQPLLFIANIAFEQSNLSGIYTTVPVTLAVLGLISYALALYHLLSGFSDVVLGLGGMLGFTYPENFNYPILSTSLTEFWHRFYSSLYTWFDEYVYQSLSKKRSNNDQMVVHMFYMWMLIGLWLGAGITKIFFAFWFFFFILLERIVEFEEHKERNPLYHVYVAVVVLLSLTALKTDNIYQFTLYVSNLFGVKGNVLHGELTWLLLKEHWLTLLASFACCFPVAAKLRHFAREKGGIVDTIYIFYPLVMLAIVFLLMMKISGASYDPSQLINFRLWG